METWQQVAIIIGAITGILALVRTFIAQGKADSGVAIEAFARLADDLRQEISRKDDDFRKETRRKDEAHRQAIREEQQECKDELGLLQQQVDSLRVRLDNGGVPE